MEQIGYEERRKISYFQVDGNRLITPAALFSHLQEGAINHSDSLGYPVEYLTEKQMGWAVINWHLEVERMPKLGETITVQTWCEKCRRMQAIRCFRVLDQKNEVIMKGISRWIFMDLEKRKPANIPDEMVLRYHSGQESAIPGEKFFMPKEVEGAVAAIRPLVITRRDTDTNGHANNVKYLEWAMDDVPDEIYDRMQLADVRIVYRKECVRGDEVIMKTFIHSQDDGKEVLTFITDREQTILAEVATLWHEKPKAAEKVHKISR
ncbi:acyl-ACP thioesterase [Anaerotignum neopropionicum]|uniref:Acyl-ACP thioesterase n=1 Tax=Anaerotignum neopropionicum TaxID=36847 RepID=A0A136WCE4_9FIRM|nr:acyl-ACP thioesterase domain-containing protein [Anaerotignum neopropionicum]KXL52019.1 acyl-ACP thioesterase [Anaerotignum neopropionicum]